LNGISDERLAALERAVDQDPGAPGFAALAEAHRRAGRLGAAERVARRGLERDPEARDGRLALGLALIDQGRGREARSLLAQLLDDAVSALAAPAAPAHGALSEAELDMAFDRAETDMGELIDPDRVAAAAVAHVDAGADDGLDEGAAREPLPIGGAFATETMAELLERQGDRSGASRIRAALGSPPAPAGHASRAGHAPASRQQWIDTLERWLGNLRGDRA
jgi:tetratricopeptide (TPR) repeat protein